MLIVGFSGTQHSLSELQQIRIIDELKTISNVHGRFSLQFHHGVCVGADEFAARIARTYKFRVHGHPGNTPNKQHSPSYSDVLYPSMPNLARNRHIVDISDVMIFAPRTMNAEIRSGTWAAYRYAVKRYKPRIVIFPDGTVGRE